MKPKILHILRGNERGGSSSVIFNLVKKLDDIGYHVTLLFLKKTQLCEKAVSIGIIVKVIDKNDGIDLKLPWRLSAFLKEEKFDLIHTHSIGSNFYGRIAKLLVGKIPLVTTVHGDTLKNLKAAFKSNLVSYLIHYIDFRMAILSEKILVVSNLLGKKLIAKGLSRNKVIVIHNGIDLEAFEKKGTRGYLKELKREFRIRKDEKIVGSVGRLIALKNYELFLKAAKDIVEFNKNVKFLIIGDGKQEKKLKKMAFDLKLNNKIIFAGWRTDLTYLYHLMNLFVLSSKSEGLPITILEAMASRKPVVATDVGGISEAVQHGKSGLLVPSDDHIALSSALKCLLNDPNRCQFMGEEGRRIVEQKFTIEKMAAETADVYSGLIS